MNSPSDILEQSYRFCRRTSRRAGSSFHAGFLLLPPEKRRAMEALYAFLRHTDDLADADAPEGERRAALAAWREAFEQSLQETTISTFDNRHAPFLLLPALADAVRRFRIPPEHLRAAIDGAAMDLDGRRYETFDELRVYCEHVASAVGLACIHIWGFRGPEAFEPARQAGIALQLTNILRDLKEDAAIGRVYVPAADLRRFGCSAKALAAGVDSPEFRRLMAFEVARAEDFYRDAARLAPWLASDGRRIFGLTMATYENLLRKIAQQPAEVLRRRVRLNRLEKARLFVRWWAGGGNQGSGFRVQGSGVRGQGSGIRGQGSEAAANPQSLNPNSSADPSLAVIGGGLAGLAAAVAARRRGFRVELFERAANLGGRAGSFVDSRTGQRIDRCQHVALGCCTGFLDFCCLAGIDDCFERAGTLHFLTCDGARRDFAPNRLLPAPFHLLPGLVRLDYLSLGERWSIVRAMRRLATVPADAEDETLGEWLRRQGQSSNAVERFWSVVIGGALSETVDRASRAAAQKVFCDGFMASRGASELVLPRRPLGEIFNDRLGRRLADEGIAVHLETPIRRIEGDASRAAAVIAADGQRREFDRVVVAVPWRDVAELLDEDLRAAAPSIAEAARLEPAAITAVHLWFDRPITRLAHAVLVDRQGWWLFARPCDEGRLPEARQYCQVVVSASHRMTRRRHDEWLAEVRRALDEALPDARPARLLHGRVVTQPAATFSVVPGSDRRRPPQRTPIQNLALAGDWTATGWPSTMEGAVRSGVLAVEAIAHRQ